MIPRYSLPEMEALWSSEHKYATWLQVELAVCEQLALEGRIPAEDLQVIREKADFDVARIDEIELTTRHDVIAFLTNVAEHVGPESRYIHMGMTSSDLLDTALALLLVEAGAIISAKLTAFRDVLRSQALVYKYAWQIGRTHGIHAEPITFGLKLAMWTDEIDRHIRRWDAAQITIATGKISGAVGTHAHLSIAVEEQVCARLGLQAAPVSNQVVQRDRHAEYLTALGLLGATLEKIALEIRHMQRTEVREAEEPFAKGQKGSSAMPHKRNPIFTEQVCGLARLLRSNALVAMENVALWHERDISHSSVERVILPDSTTLVDYLLTRMTTLMANLAVYPDRMLANIHMTGGLIFSQNILLALIENGLTREDAYALVQGPAMQVWEHGGNFKEQLLSTPEIGKILSPDKIDKCFNFEHLRSNVDAIFERLELSGSKGSGQ